MATTLKRRKTLCNDLKGIFGEELTAEKVYKLLQYLNFEIGDNSFVGTTLQDLKDIFTRELTFDKLTFDKLFFLGVYVGDNGDDRLGLVLNHELINEQGITIVYTKCVEYRSYGRDCGEMLIVTLSVRDVEYRLIGTANILEISSDTFEIHIFDLKELRCNCLVSGCEHIKNIMKNIDHLRPTERDLLQLYFDENDDMYS